jgi:hypothetical protein
MLFLAFILGRVQVTFASSQSMMVGTQGYFNFLRLGARLNYFKA